MIRELFKSTRKPHVIIVLGKGGVGKTTTALLLGSELSDASRVLVVSLDPAKHLAKYVGDGILRGEVELKSNLVVKQVDLELELKKYVEKHASWIEELLPSLRVFNIESAVDAIKYSPGIEEEVFLNVVSGLYESAGADYVVVDTPPTGVALRTLYLPALYMIWLDKLIEVRERIVALRYSISRALGRAHEIRDAALEKLYELKKKYSDLWSSLRDKNSTSYVLVCTPEPLPVYELSEAARFLREKIGVKPSLVVVNKYLPKHIASEMGVLEAQEEYVEELKAHGAPLLVVEYLGRPTKSFEDIAELKEKLRVVQSV